MLKTITKIIAIVVIALIQILLMPYFAIYGVWPNLILILAIMLLFFNADPEALFTASLGGLILDLASPLNFGFFTFFFLMIILLIKLLMSKFFNEPNIIVMIVIMVCALFVFYAIMSLFANHFSIITILINTFYDLLVSLVFYRLLHLWMDRNQVIRFKV